MLGNAAVAVEMQWLLEWIDRRSQDPELSPEDVLRLLREHVSEVRDSAQGGWR